MEINSRQKTIELYFSMQCSHIENCLKTKIPLYFRKGGSVHQDVLKSNQFRDDLIKISNL